MAPIECRAGFLLAVLTCVLLTRQVQAVSSHIMPPLKTGAQEVALIFIPGAEIDGMAYEDTARAIQQASNMSLWVALTKDYILNTPNPAQLPGAVEGAIEDLKEAGVTTDNFVGIAHSLGGVFLGPYARNSPLKAVVFLGSYLTRGNPLGEYPLPLLTLSGELDGQTRITRIAVTFKELESLVEKSPNSIYSKPVLNIKGSSHAQFASGPMPSAVKKYDLEPEISIDEAHRRIGHYVSSFVTVQFSNDEHLVAEGKANISKSYVDSQSRFKPFLDVNKIDQNQTVSPWAITMQELVASQTKNISGIKVVDRIEQYMQFVESKPSINRSNKEILVNTTSYLNYPSNPIDISTIPESPQEIQVKMKSFESLQVALGLLPSHSFSKNTTCKQLNQAAIGVAFNHSSPDAQRRYKAKGRPIILQDDVEYQTGIQWVATDLHLTEDDSGLAVQSVSLYTSMHSPILPGMYYCKSLAPYRAMEWINVDSLRKHKP